MKKLTSEQKISYHAKPIYHYRLLKIITIYFMLGMGMLNSTHAVAENWVRLTQVKDTESYIDMDSIKKYGSFVQYWQKAIFHDSTVKLNTLHTLNEVECTNSQIRTIHAIGFWQDNTQLNDNTIHNWQTVVTDSPNEIAYQYVCKRQPPNEQL